MRKEVLGIIQQAVSLGGSPEFRRRARDELLATLVRTDVNFVPHPELTCSPDPALNLLSPRGDRLAVMTNSGAVLIIGVPDGRALARFDVDGTAVQGLESFSSDGRYLAVRQVDGASIWDTATGRNCVSTNDPLCSICFIPDKPQAVIPTERKAVVPVGEGLDHVDVLLPGGVAIVAAAGPAQKRQSS